MANGHVLNRKSLKNLKNIDVKRFVVRQEQETTLPPIHDHPAFPLRYYKSLCDVCDVMEYSFNPERHTVCYNCVNLVNLRNIIVFLVEKRRKTKFNRCIFWLKNNITFVDCRTVYEEKWAHMINAFFGKMSWNIKNCVLKFLLE